MAGKKWTKEEERLLSSVWSEEMSVTETLQLFPNRTYAALIRKAIRMGLVKVRECYRNEKRLSSTLPETFFAWLAGMIDGEGCVGLYKSKRGTITCRLSIANTNLPSLICIADSIGSGYISAKNKDDPSEKVSYAYGLGDRRVLKAVLNKTLPYLKIKKPQAECLLQFLNTYTGEEDGLVEATANTLKKLNLRGVVGGREPYAKEFDEYRKRS